MISSNIVPEPRGNIFFRQELESITPDCNPKCALVCNLLLMIIFISFGIPIVITQNSIFEKKLDYTNWLVFK